MGWKTITGALVAAIGYLSRPEVLALLPQRWAAIITAAGAVLSAIGLRHAVAKLNTQNGGR
jgi:hypothetical protein